MVEWTVLHLVKTADLTYGFLSAHTLTLRLACTHMWLRAIDEPRDVPHDRPAARHKCLLPSSHTLSPTLSHTLFQGMTQVRHVAAVLNKRLEQ